MIVLSVRANNPSQIHLTFTWTRHVHKTYSFMRMEYCIIHWNPLRYGFLRTYVRAKVHQQLHFAKNPFIRTSRFAKLARFFDHIVFQPIIIVKWYIICSECIFSSEPVYRCIHQKKKSFFLALVFAGNAFWIVKYDSERLR